jgi:hypothetical protein
MVGGGDASSLEVTASFSAGGLPLPNSRVSKSSGPSVPTLGHPSGSAQLNEPMGLAVEQLVEEVA